jgi:SAM-dependent methyltransferase
MQNNYYEIHAENFIKSTFDVDMSALYDRFLKYLKPNSKILDVGCGSGRDSLAFKKMGHIVTAFDASPAMVSIASKNLSQPVLHCAFQDISFDEEFDAAWACASLLHVPLNELPAVLSKLFSALIQGGILYMSFKYGNGERVAEDGRSFTDFNEAGLKAILLT